jgi:uncharacterized membrane protein (UPF0182 family)
LVIGTIVPVIYQQFFVQPNELQKEQPYIARNIHATRDAFDLEKVAVRSFPYEQNLTAQSILDNSTTIENARLWDPPVILRNFQLFQGLQTFYKFADADVDRYVIDGKLVQTLISARELNPADLPSQTWVNRHLVYTHGYGAVLSPSNSASSVGQPNYLLSDIPPQGDIPLDRPEVYFGENLASFSLVDAKSKEFNYPQKGAGNNFNRYHGTGGVELSSWLRRAAFALRFNDFNILISGQITPKTKVLYLRGIVDRVKKAAPFLHYDADPYPVIANGRLVWLLDGYTTSDKYPYSQSFTGSGGLNGSFNYVRNSVKATVDAYDGTIRFYVIDPQDPVIQAYESAFPHLFTSYSKMPAAVKAHLRFPQDLFSAQTDVYRTYHMLDPQSFYNKEDLWDLARTTSSQGGGAEPVTPTYVVTTLPGEEKPEFLLLISFTPRNKDNLIGVMAARCDGAHLGQMVVLLLSKQQLIFGPMQIGARINQDQNISKDLTLWNQQGSQVLRGQMLVLPVGNTFLYVDPIYIQATEARMPQLKKVVLAVGDRLIYADTYDQALSQLTGEAQELVTQATTAESATSTTGQAVAAPKDPRVQQVREHLRKYRELAAQGKWSEAGKELEAIEAAVKQ